MTKPSGKTEPGVAPAPLTERERHRLLVEWNPTCREYVGSGSLHELVEAQVERTPEAVAVVFGDESLTYGELNRQSNRLARRLRALGVGPEVLVGLCVERSLEMVVGLLGILKAGGAYVPLDPTYPKERLAFLIEDTGMPVLVTQQRLMESLPAQAAKVVYLEREEESVWTESSENPEPLGGGESLAYVMHTSGSTGRPKGVSVTHRNVVRLFRATWEWFGFDGRDVWTLFHSQAFDFSVWELWGALLYGGRLVVVPYWVSRSPEDFYDLLVREKVTVLNQTPSAFRQLAAVEDARGAVGDLRLRLVIFGGEALEIGSLKSWFDRHGDERPRLVNMYGITETTVHVTYRPLRAEDASRAGSVIGRPIPDLRLYVLDAGRRLVPIGVAGELYVGGGGLARGYWNRPELTAERFVPDPFSEGPQARLYRTGDLVRYRADGDLEYLGRIDDQVKIRGYRIELGEIEAALSQHPGVREAVVVAREEEPGEKRLVAYWVSDGVGEPGVSELRAFLTKHLPDYMVPSTFVLLDAMPLTPSGKLDRRALPAPNQTRPELEHPYVAPRTALESFLAEVWREILRLDRVGIHDRFFELGGTSLQAARFMTRMQKELGEFLYIVAIFNAPSIAEFAALLRRDYAGAVAKRFPSDSAAVSPAREASRKAREIDEPAIARMRRYIPLRLPSLGGGQDGAPRNPPAIFVLAPPRSGTTLLRVMLAGHPGLFAAAELLLLGFDTLRERREAFSGKFSLWLEGTIRALMELDRCDADQAKRVMDDYERLGLTTKEFYRVLQEKIAPRTLVEKSPSYALDPEILKKAERDFGNASYVHLVRHPYAMVRSFESYHIDQVLYLRDHPFSSRELGELVWTISHQNILEFLKGVPSSRQFRMTFEDLTRQPRDVMEQMCRALSLEFHPNMVQPYKDKESKMIDGIYAESTPMGDTRFHDHQGINPNVADRWKGVAADNFLGEITWRVAESLGYERAAGPRSGETSGSLSTTGSVSSRRGFLERQQQVRRAHRESNKKGA